MHIHALPVTRVYNTVTLHKYIEILVGGPILSMKSFRTAENNHPPTPRSQPNNAGLDAFTHYLIYLGPVGYWLSMVNACSMVKLLNNVKHI